MISGRRALGSIDETLNKAHAQIEKVEDEIAHTTENLISLQKAQISDYRELARGRLERLEDDTELNDHLDYVERQALKLLHQREQALSALHQEVEQNAREREQAEAERGRQAIRLDEAVDTVDEAEATTQERLDADPDYRAQRAAAESAERKAMHAMEKADRSAGELAAKGQAYKDDPLFMYLWERSYGLPDYKAGGLTRWLDGKVARMIGFADARANFSRLSEIPQRLREHADHLAELADDEFAALKLLDEKARSEDGIPVLEGRVKDEQRVLDKIDEEIRSLEEHHRALLEHRSQYAAGEDDYTRKAVDYLTEEFRREDLSALRRDAYITPYPEDDLVVSRLLQRESEHKALEETLRDLRGLLDRHRERLKELESLRIEFKRNHYDRAGSIFTNDSMIPVLLGQFLAGMLDKRMLWKVLQEHHRYKPRRTNPDFGSGGFGRGTVWRGGLGDIGDIIGGLGRGGFGGRGGGGFGGGGGGGFRTGGGF